MTTRISRLLKAVLIPGLLATFLCAGNPATAASIDAWTSPDLTNPGGADYVPDSDISGWFLTYDPSNEWTDAANIATLQSWLAIAEGLNYSSSVQAAPQLTSSLSPVSAVPEPATLGLLGIALAILLIYVPIRRPHRSLRN